MEFIGQIVAVIDGVSGIMLLWSYLLTILEDEVFQPLTLGGEQSQAGLGYRTVGEI